jgi:hypothetical protein
MVFITAREVAARAVGVPPALEKVSQIEDVPKLSFGALFFNEYGPEVR